MNREAVAVPPRSEVLHLPTLFRRVAEGEIRIPAFQRGLVWSKEQIRALLESVYQGYPIGSLLFWSADSNLFTSYVPDAVTMPELPSSSETQYVLDGMQRLITLYAAFNGGGGDEGRFDLVFDLEERRFYHVPRQPRTLRHSQLLLKRVFSPRQFIEDQAKLANSSKADDLLSAAITLHARFQEYALPIITIVKATTDEAVKMFMNINRGGSDLSTVDFMRALTWHNDFDLNRAVNEVREALPTTFQPDDETIAKTLALLLEIDPIPDAILRLQHESVERLTAGISATRSALQEVASFLKSTFGIASADFVPYEGQMLVLAGVFSKKNIDERTRLVLRKWFLSSSLTEALQGRPDHAIVKMVREAIRSVTDGELVMEFGRDFDPVEFSRKQLRKGTASSSGFAALFSLRKARSVFSGDVIPAADYIKSFDSSKFVQISKHIFPARRLVNLVMVTASEAYDDARNVLATLLDCNDPELLRSQLLDTHAIDFLRGHEYEAFSAYRGLLVQQALDEEIET